MTFGDPTIYAIEAYNERLPGFSAQGLWGRICIHVQGVAFGDVTEEHCCLDHTFEALHNLATSVDRLWDKAFDGLTDYEIFDVLDTAMYRDVGQSLDAMQMDWSRYAHFNFLTNWGEQFDGAPKAFILRSPSGIQVLWRDASGTQQSLGISIDSFTRVTHDAHEWYKEQSIL
jgi:hypothetical protein